MLDDDELLNILEGDISNDSNYSSSSTSDEESEQEVPSSSWDSRPFQPEIFEFNEYAAGLTCTTLDTKSSESDCFQQFLCEEIVSKLAEFTNAQHQKFIRECDIRLHSRLQNWREVSVAEMYIFLAVTFLFTRNKHLDIQEHWSTDPLLQSPIFSKTMSRNRYTTILGLLSFSNPNTMSSHILKDILPILKHIKNTFKYSFTPYRDLCVDESIMPFKGYLSIKQFIPNKRNRFGIKLFMLCDVKTRYIIDFIIYCGARTEIIVDPDNLGVTGGVVTTLLQDLMQANRRVYMDNWYSSPKLYKYLYDRKTYACGTVMLNRMRKANIGQFKTLKKGEIDVKYSKPLIAIKYKDKRDIYMISTFHDATFGPTNKYCRDTGLPKMKPEIIIDYNKKKGIT